MLEGPEVFILAKAIKVLGFQVESYGKHLLIKDWNTGICYDISFGLAGKIKINPDMSIQKIIDPTIPSGYMKKINSFAEGKANLGIDWMTSNKEDLKNVILSWGRRKKKMSALLIDQHELAGIGNVWADVIFKHCHISGDTKANLFDCLSLNEKFLDAVVGVRDNIKKRYIHFLSTHKVNIKFINNINFQQTQD